MESDTRGSPAANQHVPILITMADFHGHIILNAGVKPAGGVRSLTCPDKTSLSPTDVATFPSFEQVYPFVLCFLSSQVVILGHGLDADFTGLGFRVTASRVLDTAMFLGLRAVALDMCRRTSRVQPRTVSVENPGPVGLAPLVAAIIGIHLRSPSTAHDTLAHCLVTLAVFRTVAPQLVAAWELDLPLPAAPNVGVGFPLDSVRAAYLPADLLLAAPPLRVDRRNQSHPEFAPLVPYPRSSWGTNSCARPCSGTA